MGYSEISTTGDKLQEALLELCTTHAQMERVFEAIGNYIDAKCADTYDRVKQHGDYNPDY